MKLYIRRKLLLCLASWLVASSAWAASYSIQPMTITFGRTGADSQDALSSRTLAIRNTGRRPLYLSLELEKRINPGQENERRITMADTSPEDFGLLLNNTKLIVPPGQERSVLVEALVNPETLEQEAVYSITTTPMESSKFVSESKNDMGGGIAMLLQYGIHVFVSPKNLDDSVSFNQQGNRVVSDQYRQQLQFSQCGLPLSPGAGPQPGQQGMGAWRAGYDHGQAQVRKGRG